MMFPAVSLALLLTGGSLNSLESSAVSQSSWEVNTHRTLIWSGEPYVPTGVRIDGSPRVIQAAAQAGIRDVIVDLPATGEGWSDAFAALEAAQMRYWIAVSSAFHDASFVAVMPDAYRISGVFEPLARNLRMPQSDRVLGIMASTRTSEIVQQERYRTQDGAISIAFDPRPTPGGPATAQEYVVLLYPRMTTSATPDYWEGLDRQRDNLLSSLAAHPPGRGLRGWINPAGPQPYDPFAPEQGWVPASPTFHIEFAAFLEARYGSVESVLRAWSLRVNDVQTFEDAAQLVPLWNGNRGVAAVFNSVTERVYRVTSSDASAIWGDINAVIAETRLRRTNSLVNLLKGQTGVPVVQEWSGWNASYALPETAFTGVAVRTRGTSPSQVMDAAAPGASVTARSRANLLIGSEISVPSEASRNDLERLVNDLQSMGARGVFFRADESLFPTIGQVARTLDGSADAAEWSPRAVFYPEAMRNPATPGTLPGGLLWLPRPVPGQRIQFGPEISGFRSLGSDMHLVLWSRIQDQPIRIRTTDPREYNIERMDGVELPLRYGRSHIDLTLPQVPVVVRGRDAILVPETSAQYMVAQIETMFARFENRIGMAGEESFEFTNNVRSMGFAPGTSFLELQAQYVRLGSRAAPYLWIEAERPARHNLSEVRDEVGASGDRVLAMRLALESPEPYFAEYLIRPRVSGQHQVWVAARTRNGAIPDMTVRIGEETLRPTGQRLGTYGRDFAWIAFDELPLSVENFTLRVQFDGFDPQPVDLDAILVAPVGTVPNGPLPPMDWFRTLSAGG